MLFRRSLSLCVFAPKPLPTPTPVLDFALARSHGVGVYTSKADALAVLEQVEATTPAWWNEACEDFLYELRDTPNTRLMERLAQASGSAQHPPSPIILVEGLDGVGKTTVTKALADKLGAVVIRTPDPTLDAVRSRFRVTEEPIARAFYAGANYLAARRVVEAVLEKRRPAVIDRWWTSTAAMALAAGCPEDEATAVAAKLEWPRDLVRPHVAVLLDVPEDVRRKRMAKRGDANVEEDQLAADESLRRRATAVYRSLGRGMLQPVAVPTYMHAVNEILDKLDDEASATPRRFGLPSSAQRYTETELTGCRPY